ncbi:MAG: wax ester/triacylglycerol synthase family O-acyltransferase [Alphaproteobacteria bacterium]
MATHILPPFNAAWLAIDSDKTPMHVAGLYIFQKPEDAGPDYLRGLVSDMLRDRNLEAPWNQKLIRPLGVRGLPVLVDDDKMDLDYHIRFSALPEPGGERELGELISRLHSHPLDLDRPLWECHVIGGLYDDRFAIYVKLHQALAYGPFGVNALLSTLSEDPYQRGLSPVWGTGLDDQAGVPNAVGGGGIDAWGRGVVAAGTSMAGRLTVDRIRRAYSRSAPKSLLTGRVGSRRRVATQVYDQSRVNAVMTAAGMEQEVLVYYLISTTLRRYLKEYNALPDESMIAGITVPVEGDPDVTPGAAIGMIKLATNKADPLVRLEKLKAGFDKAKAKVAGMNTQAAMLHSLSMMQPYIVGAAARSITGFGTPRIPWNLFISNYHGPDGPLYFNGAPLETYFPVPPLWQGAGLAVSALSANGKLGLSVTGDRERVAHMQRLAVYMEDAFAGLERALTITTEAAQ